MVGEGGSVLILESAEHARRRGADAYLEVLGGAHGSTPDGLTGRYLRRSLPLRGLLAQVGLALAGRAGARLAAVLGAAAHRTTLLRLVAALPEPGIGAAPQILGVDNFALRRGQVYGTVPRPARSPAGCCPARPAWIACAQCFLKDLNPDATPVVRA